MSVLRSERQDSGVLRLWMERPSKRNALSRELLTELYHVVTKADEQGVRVIVLAGSGPCFSAGADFAQITGTQADEQYDDLVAELTSAIRNSQAVVVAALHGVCMGAALDLAMACDLRIAAPNTRFALPAAKVGILYNPESLARIFRALSPSVCARLLLQADVLNGSEALAAGIATQLVDEAELEAKTLAIASSIAGLPQRAVCAAKQALSAHLNGDFNAQDWQALRRTLLGSAERHSIIFNINKG